jgi:amidohydrolase
MSVIQEFNKLVEQIESEVIAWRRHIHKNPELSYNEKETADFVFNILNSFGNITVTRPTATSVMGRLIGAYPGKVLALRADMDALPITELNECEYKSQNQGVMHACGHDGHTASLLGTAKIISQMQDQIKGEVRFFFQPAEEKCPGGAIEMIEAGVMDGVDVVIGIHLWSPMPLGKIGIISGAMMASPDSFEINILGKGGHGGFPHQTIDPIVIGASVVNNLQQIVSRKLDPLDSVVISVTKFIAGTADNVIPSAAVLGGTVRSFDEQVREKIPQLMEQVINGISSAHGANYEFTYSRGYSPVINHPAIAGLLETVVSEDFGTQWVEHMRPNMGGEDFSAYLKKAPGCFIFVGAGNVDKGIIHPHHHPQFQIDEDALAVSMRIFLGTISRVVF